MASPSTSDELASRISYRPEQATLLEVTDSPSSMPRPVSEKNMGLLTVISGPGQGSIISFDAPELTLGRSKKAGYLIPDPSLSRVHARFFHRSSPVRSDFFVEDSGSTNGTFVDGARIGEPTLLTNGCRVDLGRRTSLRFSLQDDMEAEALIRVHQSAQHDRLTGVFNRGVLDDRLALEVTQCAARGVPLALFLFDIDHFKQLNDTYGHPAGDAVLVAVAQCVQGAIRKEDFLARYGGEEFAVILRAISERSARLLAEQVRVRIAQLVTNWGGLPLGATVSVGLAHAPTGRTTAATLVQRADRALYEAKRTGRNRVVVAG